MPPRMHGPTPAAIFAAQGVGRPRHLCHHCDKVQAESPSPLRADLFLQRVGLWAWRKRVRAGSTSQSKS